MNIEDILALAKSGFTADQISRFAAISQPQSQTQPQTQSQTQTQPQSQTKPQSQTQPQTQTKPDFSAQLAALTAAIQANGILGSAQPKQETAEDILASIINPPAKEVK